MAEQINDIELEEVNGGGRGDRWAYRIRVYHKTYGTQKSSGHDYQTQAEAKAALESSEQRYSEHGYEIKFASVYQQKFEKEIFGE